MLAIEPNVRSVQAIFAVCIRAEIIKGKRNYWFLIAADKDSGEECEEEAITDRQQIYSTMDIHRNFIPQFRHVRVSGDDENYATIEFAYI